MSTEPKQSHEEELDENELGQVVGGIGNAGPAPLPGSPQYFLLHHVPLTPPKPEILPKPLGPPTLTDGSHDKP